MTEFHFCIRSVDLIPLASDHTILRFLIILHDFEQFVLLLARLEKFGEIIAGHFEKGHMCYFCGASAFQFPCSFKYHASTGSVWLHTEEIEEDLEWWVWADSGHGCDAEAAVARLWEW